MGERENVHSRGAVGAPRRLGAVSGDCLLSTGLGEVKKARCERARCWPSWVDAARAMRKFAVPGSVPGAGVDSGVRSYCVRLGGEIYHSGHPNLLLPWEPCPLSQVASFP